VSTFAVLDNYQKPGIIESYQRETNMSFFTRQQRYEMLCAIKRGQREGTALTAEEEQFIQDYAQEKLFEILEDPEIMAVLKRMKDR